MRNRGTFQCFRARRDSFSRRLHDRKRRSHSRRFKRKRGSSPTFSAKLKRSGSRNGAEHLGQMIAVTETALQRNFSNAGMSLLQQFTSLLDPDRPEIMIGRHSQSPLKMPEQVKSIQSCGWASRTVRETTGSGSSGSIRRCRGKIPPPGTRSLRFRHM